LAVRPRGKGFQADITVKGQRLREHFDTIEAAKAWELEARAAVLRGDPIPRPNGSGAATAPKPGQYAGENSLSSVLDKTFQRFWKGGPSEGKTLINMKQVEAYFGTTTPITAIDMDAIEGFVDHCIAKNNSNGTINRKLAVLSKALRYARDKGMIAAIPKIERKKDGVGRIRWLTVDEEKALLDLMRGWDRNDHADVVEVLIDTGFRPSEVYSLTPRDVDLKAGSLTVWKTKTDHPRTVYMTRRVAEIVRRRISAATAPNDRLFPYDNFWMRYVWDRARVQLGFANDEHFVPYICRHTCASRLVQRGIPINVVKEWMGHKSIQMTMRYAHLAPQNLKAAAGVLEAAE